MPRNLSESLIASAWDSDFFLLLRASADCPRARARREERDSGGPRSGRVRFSRSAVSQPCRVVPRTTSPTPRQQSSQRWTSRSSGSVGGTSANPTAARRTWRRSELLDKSKAGDAAVNITAAGRSRRNPRRPARGGCYTSHRVRPDVFGKRSNRSSRMDDLVCEIVSAFLAETPPALLDGTQTSTEEPAATM